MCITFDVFKISMFTIDNCSASSSVPSFNFKTSTVTPVETVMGGKKMMPDITNNTLRKNISSDKLKGNFVLREACKFHMIIYVLVGSNSNSGLPDVTASTGFGGFLPAKELKTGSVMDILGKHFSFSKCKQNVYKKSNIYRFAKVRVLM